VKGAAPRTTSGGFTLIELVVALAVTGVALAFAVAAFAQVVDLRETFKENVDHGLAAAAARAAITAWVREARLESSSGAVFSGMDSRFDGSLMSASALESSVGDSEQSNQRAGIADDELTLTTAAQTLLGIPLTTVRIFVDRDPGTFEQGLVAELRQPEGLESRTVVLDAFATGLDVRYLSSVTGESRWLPSWISSSVLPRGVEIRVLHEPPSEVDEAYPLLALPIRVALDEGR
jgi:prepilin-type N-terminal cleavage/methylation domain-containing protein